MNTENYPNYRVSVYSRVGGRSQILDELQMESSKEFEGLLDALDWITSRAKTAGWRHFELITSDNGNNKPLRKADMDLSRAHAMARSAE